MIMMPVEQNSKSPAPIQKSSIIKENSLIIILGSVIIIIFGAFLMFWGVYARNDPSGVSEWFIEAGRTVLVTGVMVYFYEFVLRHLFLRKTRDIFEKTIESMTTGLKLIDERVNLFGENFEKIQKTVVFAKEAMDSGLVTIHATRESALKILENKIDQTKDPTTIYLCGISLGDFFLERGKLHNLFVQWLEKKDNLKFRVIMLDAKSEAAEERAIREEPQKYCEIGYNSTCAYTELIASHTNAEWLNARYPKKLELKVSTAPALCFLAIINETMFMEPYNYARRGSEAPVLEIKLTKLTDEDHFKHDLFKIYQGHFESLWNKPNQGKEDSEKLCASKVQETSLKQNGNH